MVYVVESGRIKIVMLSPDGKECLIGIHTAGDLFGESYFGCGHYQETATAMEDTILIRITLSALLQYVASKQSILSGALQYLARRIADQQQTILDLMTVNSECRLGKALLRLGDKLGEKHLSRIRLKHKISHEELSQIVGTTRPRISEFMNKFRELGLIELSEAGFIIINRQKLADYLA